MLPPYCNAAKTRFMSQSIALITIDFRTASVALRERLAFPEHSLGAALTRLQDSGVAEAAILSTCNRVEIIAVTDTPDTLAAFLCGWHTLSPQTLSTHSRTLQNEQAVRHLMRVASGLESLVPGEMQILGQVKEAYQSARQAGMAGHVLTRVFDRAIAAGRRARHETGIAYRPVSISHAAVTRIRQQFQDDLRDKNVLLIGSGKMGALAAQQLRQAGAHHLMIANRTLEHACNLARNLHGEAFAFNDLPRALLHADAVMSATGAPHLILSRDMVADALAQRPAQPLLLLDLAVPRDIDPAVATLPHVTLCDVDGLQEVVAQNIALRHEERDAVEAIIEEELSKWRQDQAVRMISPTIVHLRQQSETIRQREVEKALRRLRHLSDDEKAIIEALSRGLVNKLLHNPTARLREKASTSESDAYQQLVEELFALEGVAE